LTTTSADPADFPQQPSIATGVALDTCIVGPTPDDAIRQLMPLIDLGVTLVTILVPSRSSATLGEEPS
jgi:hypothetical protein